MSYFDQASMYKHVEMIFLPEALWKKGSQAVAVLFNFYPASISERGVIS